MREAKGLLAFLYWLGNFHPPLVSLPIGVLLAAALAELLHLLAPRPTFDAAARFCLWLGAAGALLAGVLGWLLAGFRLTDGHWLLTTHRWVGTATVAWSLLVLVLGERSRRPGRPPDGRGAYRFALFAGVLLVLGAGFFGGAMVYGIEHYALPG